VLYGELDPASGEFHYARAGHEPPLVQSALGIAVEPPAAAYCRGQLLGIFGQPELDEQRVRVEAGGTLLLYTDGAREATDSDSRMFGEAGLRAALAAAPAKAQVLCDGLLEQVGTHRGPLAQQDDITLLAVRASAGAFD